MWADSSSASPNDLSFVLSERRNAGGTVLRALHSPSFPNWPSRCRRTGKPLRWDVIHLIARGFAPDSLKQLIARNCYVHEIQAGRNFLTYSNYIFTDFDNRRITTIGKIHQGLGLSNLFLQPSVPQEAPESWALNVSPLNITPRSQIEGSISAKLFYESLCYIDFFHITSLLYHFVTCYKVSLKIWSQNQSILIQDL